MFVAALLPTAACPDPDARFDDFVESVPDATVITMPDAAPLEELPDVTGEHLMGIAPVISPDTPMQFVATATLTQLGDGTGLLDLTLVALDVTTRMPVGNPQSVTGVEVSMSGTFTAVFDNVVIAGAANPITGSDITADVQLVGNIRSADRFCGLVEGMVKSPAQISLTGSTFSAIRITPGTVGAALPPVEKECPESDTSDAAPPDASI